MYSLYTCCTLLYLLVLGILRSDPQDKDYTYVKCRSLGLKKSRRLAGIPRCFYLIVGVWLLAVRKRCQLVVDQGLDSGCRHAIWNPILADNHVQTEKV